MDPLTALLAWIGVSVISLAAAALMIVAEMRDHSDCMAGRAAPAPKSGGHQSRRAWSMNVEMSSQPGIDAADPFDPAMSAHRSHPPQPQESTSCPLRLPPT